MSAGIEPEISNFEQGIAISEVLSDLDNCRMKIKEVRSRNVYFVGSRPSLRTNLMLVTATGLLFAENLVKNMPKGASVSIIGAGPCGVAVAGYLKQCGVEVSIYDKSPNAMQLLKDSMHRYVHPTLTYWPNTLEDENIAELYKLLKLPLTSTAPNWTEGFADSVRKQIIHYINSIHFESHEISKIADSATRISIESTNGKEINVTDIVVFCTGLGPERATQFDHPSYWQDPVQTGKAAYLIVGDGDGAILDSILSMLNISEGPRLKSLLSKWRAIDGKSFQQLVSHAMVWKTTKRENLKVSEYSVEVESLAGYLKGFLESAPTLICIHPVKEYYSGRQSILHQLLLRAIVKAKKDNVIFLIGKVTKDQNQSPIIELEKNSPNLKKFRDFLKSTKQASILHQINTRKSFNCGSIPEDWQLMLRIGPMQNMRIYNDQIPLLRDKILGTLRQDM